MYVCTYVGSDCSKYWISITKEKLGKKIQTHQITVPTKVFLQNGPQIINQELKSLKL